MISYLVLEFFTVANEGIKKVADLTVVTGDNGQSGLGVWNFFSVPSPLIKVKAGRVKPASYAKRGTSR
jgi:hypothetical protein